MIEAVAAKASQVTGWVPVTVVMILWTSLFVIVLQALSRSRSAERSARALLVAVIGIVAACAVGLGFLYLADSADDFLERITRGRPPDVTADWNREMIPQERHRASLAIAQSAFSISGEVTMVLSTSGVLEPFLPTAADYAKRRKWLDDWAQILVAVGILRQMAKMFLLLPLFAGVMSRSAVLPTNLG